MTILLAIAAVLLFLIVVGVAVPVGRRVLRIVRERQALARTATTLSAWLAEHSEPAEYPGPSAGRTVPVSAYPELETLLEREVPGAARQSRFLGPALVGMELRLHLAARAFRDAYRAVPPNLPFCREAVEQLQLTLIDLERTLGLAKPVARPAE